MTFMSLFVTHLWQSTLFAAGVGIVTLALRRNHAGIRHVLWLVASIKFLVPVAALTALGAAFAPALPAKVIQNEIVIVINGPGPQLFLAPPLLAATSASRSWLPAAWPMLLAAVWLSGVLAVLVMWAIRWRRVAAIAREARTIDEGREYAVLRRLEREAGVTTPIRLLESDTSLEPGVFGIVRPVLVWPRAITDRLSEPQVITILAHEVAHVRRRDNLTAAMHMAVEAMFWFHPLVWWLGARLVDERERACDEAVMRSGSERAVYAETILTACRVFVEAPLACMAGVTGSDLRRRIERIMAGGPAEALTIWKKTLVAALPIAAIVGPVAFGVMHPRPLRAEPRIHARRQSAAAPDAPARFEVASVKPTKPGIGKSGIQTSPGGRFNAVNVTLRQLIRFAYQLQDSQLAGGPKWMDDDHFDIVAKADHAGPDEPYVAEQAGQPSPSQLMLRALLADRFKMASHMESRELAIYALVAARRDGNLGPQLKPSDADCSGPEADARARALAPRCGVRILPGNITGGGATLRQLAGSLAMMVGRIVIDRTGLENAFDFTLTWTPDQIPQGFDKKGAAIGLPPIDPNGPSIFTAVQEQLGLKLDSQKAPVDVLVIDRADHPVEN